MVLPSTTNLYVTATLYVVPRVLTFTAKKLTQRYGDLPLTNEANQKIKEVMSAAADNIFLSYFLFQYMADYKAINLFTATVFDHVAGGIGVTCVVIHIIRNALCKRFPNIQTIIKPSYSSRLLASR